MRLRGFLLLCAVLLAGESLAQNSCLSNATGAWNAAGTWTACGGAVPGAADTATIRNGHTVTITSTPISVGAVSITNGVLQFTGGAKALTIGTALNPALSISATGTLNVNTASNNTHTLTVNGNISNAGTITCGTATDLCNLVLGGTTQTLSGAGTTQINNLTVNATSTTTLSTTSTFTVVGTTTLNGDLAIGSATGAKTFTGNVAINNGGSWNNSGNGPVTLGANLTNNAGGTFTSGNGTGSNAMTFSAATATITGTTAITFSGAVNFSGNLAVAAGTTNFANAVSVTGTTTVTGTLGITGATGTKTFTGTVTLNNAAAAWNNTANADVTLGASLTRTNGTFTSGTGKLTFSAASATLTGNMTFSGNTVATTLVIAGGNVMTNAGTADISGDINLANGTSGWTNAASSTLNLTGNFTGNAAGDLTVSAGTPGTATCNTVNYKGTGQTVKPAVTSYCNLVVSGTGATVAAAATVGIFGDLTVSGSLTPNATSTVAFNGTSGTQTVTGALAFGNLTINNSGTKVQFKNANTASGTLTLTAGVVDLDTDGVTLEVTSSCATIARTGGWIDGSVTLHFPTAAGTTTCTFHIGDAATYSPVRMDLTGASTALTANLMTARVNTPDHAEVTTGVAGIIPDESVNRYWTITKGGSFTFTSYSATFVYVSGDNDDTTAAPQYEIVQSVTAGSWSTATMGVPNATCATTPSSTCAVTSGRTTSAVFAIGKVLTGFVAEYRMEQASWNGTAGEVTDTSGAGQNGTRVGSAQVTVGGGKVCNGATIPNNAAQATIDAIQSPLTPNTIGSRGTITFWYKSTPAWVGGGNRQLFDASTAAAAAKFFSLALLTTGRLRFAVKDQSNNIFTADSPVTATAANTWVHIGIVWSLEAGSSTATFYINGAAVTTTVANALTTDMYNAYQTLYFGDNRDTYQVAGTSFVNSANGVLDEIRIYRGTRTAAEVLSDNNATGLSCTTTANPARFNAFETSTAANSVTGVIKTKIAGDSSAARQVAIVALPAAHGTVDTGFVGTVKVEVLDASSDAGAFDPSTGCRSSWVPVTPALSPVLSTLTFAAADAGRKNYALADQVLNAYKNVRLRITYPATYPTGSPSSGSLIGCSTDNFAIRPASLVVSATDATWTTAGTARALNNSSSVHKAGQPFTLTATAYAFNGSTQLGFYDGSPTVASLALLNPLPTSAECTGGNPPCNAGTLSPGSFASIGSGQTSAASSYNEVGAIQIAMEDKTFANVDLADSSATEREIPPSSAASIGRFVPNHFVVAANSTPKFQTFGVADAACGGSAPKRSFTYIGQTFNWQTAPSITITAKEAGGATTKLYRGALFKIAPSDITFAYSGNSGGATFNATSAAASVTANHDGTGVATAGSDTFSYTRQATPLAAFTASISTTMDARDSSEGASFIITTDSGSGVTPVAFNSIAFDGGDFSATLTGGKTFVYGRARLLNAYGSSLNDLPVTLSTEYYNGSTFTTNAKDNCTSFSSGNFQLTTALTGVTVSISGTLTAGVSNLRLTKPSSATAQGSATLCLDLDTNDATCSATAANKGYLQGAWNSGSNDKDPKNGIGFGIYGMPRNVIYLRENY